MSMGLLHKILEVCVVNAVQKYYVSADNTSSCSGSLQSERIKVVIVNAIGDQWKT